MQQFYYASRPEEFRAIGSCDTTTMSRFHDAVYQNGIDKALAIFPTEWKWLGEDASNQKISDMPAVIGAGAAFSQRAFEVLKDTFPDEMKVQAEIVIDDHKFIWMLIPPVKRQDIDNGACGLNMVVEVGRYKKCFSEDFVNLWKSSGFVGREFAPMY